MGEGPLVVDYQFRHGASVVVNLKTAADEVLILICELDIGFE